jgi:hypothetical protein
MEAAGQIETAGRGRPRGPSKSAKSSSVYEGPQVDPKAVEAAKPIVRTVLDSIYQSFDAPKLSESEADMMARSTVALIDHYTKGRAIHPAVFFGGALAVCTLARRNEIAASIEARSKGEPKSEPQNQEGEIRDSF